MPSWMDTIDSFTPAKALGIGVLLSAVNPKNLPMSVAAALSIAQASIPTGQEIGVLIIYIVLRASTVLAPVAVYLATGDRAATILDAGDDGSLTTQLSQRFCCSYSPQC